MSSKTPLKPNPFTTYRDPATGRWVVVQPVAEPPEPPVNLSIVPPSIEVPELCCA